MPPASATRCRWTWCGRMLLLRANALAVGLSGIRPEVVELLVDMLNRGVHPVVPSRGSVGASGDLAPLAHLALVLIGEGEAGVEGRPRSRRARRSRAAGLAPVALEAKEGLALLNGTQLHGRAGRPGAARRAAAGALGRRRRRHEPGSDGGDRGRLRRRAARGPAAPRPGGRGGATCARCSPAPRSRRRTRTAARVQDAVLAALHAAGARRRAATRSTSVARVLAVEMNAATDNPLVFADAGEVVSGGNFHGEPLALALDYATIAVAELASHLRAAHRPAGRRAPVRPARLPVRAPGLRSGLMIAQYTAAALVNELQTLAHPASVDTIPTSANQEDHVSMGATGALHLREVVDRTEAVLAVEALLAARAWTSVSRCVPAPAPPVPMRRSANASRTWRRTAHRPMTSPPCARSCATGSWRSHDRAAVFGGRSRFVRRHPGAGAARLALPDLRLLGAPGWASRRGPTARPRAR